MEDQLLFEQFHAAFDVELRPGSLERFRSTLVSSSHRPQRRRWSMTHWTVKSPGALAFVAALLAIAIVITLVFTAQALRSTHNEQVNPPTHRTPVPANATVIHSVSITAGASGGISIRRPIPIAQPILNPCALEAQRYGCMAPAAPTFTNTTTGWITSGSAAPEGPTDLYRTDDAGNHWRLVAGWDYTQAQEVISGSGGMELLIVTGWSWQGPAIFHSSDGGATWVSEPFPLTRSQADAVSVTPVTHCKGAHFLCSQDPAYFPAGEIYFSDPRNGWVLTQEPSYTVADLFHTSDSGANWAVAARIDIKAQFGLDLAAGVPIALQTPLPPGKGAPTPNHDLAGQLVFQNALDGWFAALPFIYRTTDGGRSWNQVVQPSIKGADSSSITLRQMRFFDNQNGVLVFLVPDAAAARTVISRTADGGATWSPGVQLPIGAGNFLITFDLIDAQAWIAYTSSADLIRTLDSGAHWETLPRIRLGGGLAGYVTFDFVDRLHGWSYSGAGLFATSDGGIHWTQVSIPSTS